MKRLFSIVLFVLLSVAVMGQMANDYTVRFIGRLNGAHYQRMDSVRFTNLTRGWSETIIYPDTIIVLNATVDVLDNEFKTGGFEQNVPNPFDCHTMVELSVPQDENVRLQLFDAAGKQCAELNVALNAGSHKFEITASKPQAYILKAVAGAKTYSVRMINVGSCGRDGIRYSGKADVLAKFYTENEFFLGDNIEYVGFANIDGETIESERFTQPLVMSQDVILQFTYYLRPSVETLAATEISLTSAKINALITNDGGAEIAASGFYYGHSPDSLEYEVVSSSMSTSFSAVINSLEVGATYYYKAYATNIEGTAYGEILSFTTDSAVIMVDGLVLNVGCGQAFDFYDSGGSNGGYSNSENMNATFTSEGRITLSFSSFETGSSDYMDVYDNNEATGQRLIYYATGSNIPSTVTAYSGAMTIVWHSDGSVTRAGWEATISADCEPVIPRVTTDYLSNVTNNTATISANVTYGGNDMVTERGFLYGTHRDSLYNSIQSGSGTGSYTAELTGLSSGSTYYFKAYATNSVGTGYGQVWSFETDATPPASLPSGYMNEHGYVDLGLPSGTLWATCNLGATLPLEAGNHYAWGELSTKNQVYNWTTYRYCNRSSNTLTKYCSNSSYGNNGFTDALNTLEASDDAATANWGSVWRMPTNTEFDELNTNCTVIWTTQNGMHGNMYVGPNGNSIFLPCAEPYNENDMVNPNVAYYWSSSLSTNNPTGAWGLVGDYENSSLVVISRSWGLAVRPVCHIGNDNDSTTISVPTVITNAVSNITAYGAIFSGNVISDGGAFVTARGFMYGTSADNLTEIVQCGNSTGAFTRTIRLNPATTYYYRTYATNIVDTAYGEEMSFTTENVGEPTGMLNGYEWVDLALPSGTKWATCNVGATNPEDYGDYFAWGETSPKDEYSWDAYMYANGISDDDPKLTKYCNESRYGNNSFSDTLTLLEACDDAATANWGAGWRMPTDTEMAELRTNCTMSWTTQNGVNGRLFTGQNGNSIFLPAAGYYYNSGLVGVGSSGGYYSSSLYTGCPNSAWNINFYSGGCSVNRSRRCSGLSVRPVCSPQY